MASFSSHPLRQRQLVAPHGVATTVQFYGHNPGEAYADAAKIKTLDVHPVYPWVVTADEEGTVIVWDYAAETIVSRFSVEGVKDAQRGALEALEAHAALAASQGVAVPDVSGPGLGLGGISDVGATVGPGTEGFVSGLGAGGTRRRPVLGPALEELRAARTGTGGVRSVCFADGHVLALTTGCGRGDYADLDPCGRAASSSSGAPPSAASLSELAAMLSYSGGGGGEAAQAQPQPQLAPSWVVVACEHRALVFDYVTRASIDVPYSALLVEAGGGALGAGARVLGKGRPSSHAVTLIGPGALAFGCDDGAVRVWSAEANAVVQTLRMGGPSSAASSGRPVTHLFTACTSPHGVPETMAFHSAGSSGAAAARGSRSLLLAGCSDGGIAVWDILPGGSAQVAPVPTHSLRLGSDLVSLTLSRSSLTAVALGADKSVAVWDVSGPAAGPGGAPRLAASSPKLVTSSPAAETGVGSRLTAAVSVGAHPALPPHALVVAGKGPQLELAVLSPGGGGGGSDAGVVFLDLRPSRPGLPSKLKIYALVPHPFRPETLVAGTNIGVFVVCIAPVYPPAALIVSHPSWLIPQHVVASATPRSASDQQRAQREGRVVLHVSPGGQLVALEAAVATPHSTQDVVDTAAAAAAGGGEGEDGGEDPTPQLPVPSVDLTVHPHILALSIAPFNPPPPTSRGGLCAGGTPSPTGAVHSAVAALAGLMKGGAVVPGGRGVRLRVSGSGRYVSAVWPDYRCFAVFRLTFGPLGGVCGPQEREEWCAEYVDGGQGLDVAWCADSWAAPIRDRTTLPSREALPSQRQDATAAGGGGGNEDSASVEEEGGEPQLVRRDRYVVIEPGAPITGRGPMGGGMSIGSTAPKGKKDAAANRGASGAIPTAPSKLLLKELPVDAGAMWGSPGARAPALPQPITLISQVTLSGEPVAVWGGPVLAVAVAPDSAAASSAAPLASATLQWLGWEMEDPALRSAEEVAKEAAMAARYSGLGSAPKGPEPCLAPLTSFASCPPPGSPAHESGSGVAWSQDCSRVAVLLAGGVHVFAAAAEDGPQRRLTDVCELPNLRASSATWCDGVLLLATLDGRTLAVFPPLVRPAASSPSSRGKTAASSPSSGPAASGEALPRGLPVEPVVLELACLAPGPCLPGQLTPTPPARRGVGNPHSAVPVGLARGHLLSAHWGMGEGYSASAISVDPAAVAYGAIGGVTCSVVPACHPAFRAFAALVTLVAPPAAAASAPNEPPPALASSLQYARACVEAARWASTLPLAAQTDVGISLARLGGLAAALLLPGLDAQHGVYLALSTQGPAFRGGPDLRGHDAVDVPVALSWLCSLCERSDGDTFMSLCGGANAAFEEDCSGATPNSGGGGSAWDVVGVWPQVAAFMSVAARAMPAEGAAVGRALGALVARLEDADLPRAAAMVAAVAPPPPPAISASGVSASGGGPTTTTQSSGVANIDGDAAAALPSSLMELARLLAGLLPQGS